MKSNQGTLIGGSVVVVGLLVVLSVFLTALYNGKEIKDITSAVTAVGSIVGTLVGAFFGMHLGSTGKAEADRQRDEALQDARSARDTAIRYAAAADPERAKGIGIS